MHIHIIFWEGMDLIRYLNPQFETTTEMHVVLQYVNND